MSCVLLRTIGIFSQSTLPVVTRLPPGDIRTFTPFVVARCSALLFFANAIFGCAATPSPSIPLGPDPSETTSTTKPNGPSLATLAVDRVVVRWHAPETGGIAKPQFVFARELSFEARIEGLLDPDPDGSAYSDRHVRAALDRHIAETLLAALPTLPEPRPTEIAVRAEDARGVLAQRVGGRERLLEAAASEGISSDELDAMLRRQAKASLYLDRMVAPMLEPTEIELKALHRAGQTPFTKDDFEDKAVKDRVKRWYIGVRLSQALDTYFQNARSRISIVTVKSPGPAF